MCYVLNFVRRKTSRDSDEDAEGKFLEDHHFLTSIFNKTNVTFSKLQSCASVEGWRYSMFPKA